VCGGGGGGGGGGGSWGSKELILFGVSELIPSIVGGDWVRFVANLLWRES